MNRMVLQGEPGAWHMDELFQYGYVHGDWQLHDGWAMVGLKRELSLAIIWSEFWRWMGHLRR